MKALREDFWGELLTPRKLEVLQRVYLMADSALTVGAIWAAIVGRWDVVVALALVGIWTEVGLLKHRRNG